VKIGFYILLTLGMMFNVCAGFYPPDVEERIKQVESNLSTGLYDTLKWSIGQRMNYHTIQGLSIAVVNNFQIEWAKGYGWADKKDKRPVTTATLFQAASISKSLNALGIMSLYEANKLDLYKDINEILKSWKFPYDSVSKNKKITVANLISHTAGLGIHGFIGYKQQDTLPTIYEILDGKKPANSPPIRSELEPGLKYQYSGGGVMISQLIAMDITSQSYAQFMQENILNPIGMTSSFYTQPPPEDRKDDLATGYYLSTPLEGKYLILPEQAAAGLWTNPSDLCKFIIEMQLSLAGKSNKILSKESTLMMMTPYIDKSSAFGTFIANPGSEKYFSHGGVNDGFRALYIGSFTEGTGVVIMNNSFNDVINSELVNSVVNVYKWKGYYKPAVDVSEENIVKNDVSIHVFDDFIAIDDIEEDSFFEIYNLMGLQVLTAQNAKFIDISGLSSGIYFLKSKKAIKKFIKQ